MLTNFGIGVFENLVDVVQPLRVDVEGKIRERYAQGDGVLDGKMLGLDEILHLPKEDLVQPHVLWDASMLLCGFGLLSVDGSNVCLGDRWCWLVAQRLRG